MKPSRVRLTVAAILFLGWIGWLAYLAATTTRPVVLSRPQFLAADLYAIATLKRGPDDADLPAEEATVQQVVWSKDNDDLEGKTIVVKNLIVVKTVMKGDPPQAESTQEPTEGWAGPGVYLIPLTRKTQLGQSVYEVTRIPRSPGYPSRDVLGPARIYPATPVARRELQDLKAEFHP